MDQKNLREPLLEPANGDAREARNGNVREEAREIAYPEEVGVLIGKADEDGGPKGFGSKGSRLVSTEERGMLIAEAKAQLGIALPMIAVTLLQNIIFFVSLVFVGHLGELELAGAAIGTSFCSVTGQCVLIGLASGLETLCGQAFGAQHYMMLGIYLQRALVVLYVISVPLAFIWLNMEAVLLGLGQDPEIAAFAGVYAFYLLPSLFVTAAMQGLSRYLQTQSIVLPLAVASMAGLLVQIPLNYILIYTLGFGFKGAAMAVSAAYLVNLLVLLAYIWVSGVYKKTWGGFSWAALSGIPQFLALAIPAAAMICLEYWCFEIMTLLSGLLPNPKLSMSALSVLLNTAMLAYMIPYGLSVAASTRVANALGAGRPYEARRSAIVAGIMSGSQGLAMAICMIALRRKWAYVYTSEGEVLDYVASLMPFLTLSSLIDSFQAVISGVARGSGWQHIAAMINLAAYYVVGLPLSGLLGFHFQWGGKGLWIGLTCGLFFQMVTMLIVTLRTNWQATADAAVKRVTSIPTLSNMVKPEEA